MIAFDDGPVETTGAILDTLAEHGAQAAFFVVGERIAGNEELLRRMVVDGHEIGSHGWSHTAPEDILLSRFAVELVDAHQAILDACGYEAARYRPPFRRIPQAHLALAEAMYARVELESSLGDYDLNANAIVAMAALVPPGRTVWLHDDVDATVDALPRILTARAALEQVAA